MSSSMRNFMEAYSAVHSVEAKEEYYSQRDPVSEMNTASLTDNDLREISEEICETLFAEGLTPQEAADVLSDVLAEGDNTGRNAKLSRLFDAFAETFTRIQSKAKQLEGFAEYRYSKRLQETWSVRHSQEKRVQRHHAALVAEDVAVVKAGLLKMIEGYQPLPKEKMERQSNKAYAKEVVAARHGKGKETNKQMQRRIAMQNPAGRKAQLAKEEKDPCWDSHKKVGMKKKGGKMVPNCVPKNEEFVAEKKGSKPDYLDFDGDGDEKETMKKALSDKKKGKKGMKEGIDPKGAARMDAAKGKMKKEEVEEYVDFLISEGYNCSDLTWDDMSEEYESLDEGLRSAVKRLLGKKKEEPAKPMSRGDQLRKKYNVGPERSDTSAKAQILQRTRAKAERDQKEFGGSRYSKGVADRSKAAHERQLKGGYSKYGADDARGSGNKARKRAAALSTEEVTFSETELARIEEIVNSWVD
jgi:hypothetical protein